MLLKRWDGQRAGIAGLLSGVVIGVLIFGLNLDVLWVALAKGLLLAIFVLAVLWPALLLYNLASSAGGIHSMARYLEFLIHDHGLLLIVLAWAFSGMLEGLAGFGLPIAIVAPMLVALGVAPVTAVAAVAVGHAWAITFGDMGVIYQTLIAVTHLDSAALAPYTALLLGVACVGCGLATTHLLGYRDKWRTVVVLGLLMSAAQYLSAIAHLTSIAALIAGAVGIVAAVFISRWQHTAPAIAKAESAQVICPSLIATLAIYGGLTALLVATICIQPVYDLLNTVSWQARFPSVATLTGFVTPAGTSTAFRPFTHPGSATLLVFVVGYIGFRRAKLLKSTCWHPILATTWRAAVPATVSIIAMVCLSMIMEYTGMTMLLARGLSNVLGLLFPLVSPLVGILGAFATGSNNNSNVLFAPLQLNVAELLGFLPAVLVAAQTTGGALGSMVAPAKLVVGCSTVGLEGRDGEVLRQTIRYIIPIDLVVGVLALLLCLL